MIWGKWWLLRIDDGAVEAPTRARTSVRSPTRSRGVSVSASMEWMLTLRLPSREPSPNTLGEGWGEVGNGQKRGGSVIPAAAGPRSLEGSQPGKCNADLPQRFPSLGERKSPPPNGETDVSVTYNVNGSCLCFAQTLAL